MTRFAPGSIARLHEVRGDPWDPNRIEYVCVLAQPERPFVGAHPELRVAPISFAVEFAADADLICRIGEGGLSRPFLVELWNQCAILVEELDPNAVGVLSPATLVDMYAVHNAMVDATESVPADVAGPPIESEGDPRIAYQGRRADLAESLTRRSDELLARATGRTAPLRGVHGVVTVATFDAREAADAKVVRPWLAPADEKGSLTPVSLTITAHTPPRPTGPASDASSTFEARPVEPYSSAGTNVYVAIADPSQRPDRDVRYASAAHSLALAG